MTRRNTIWKKMTALVLNAAIVLGAVLPRYMTVPGSITTAEQSEPAAAATAADVIFSECRCIPEAPDETDGTDGDAPEIQSLLSDEALSRYAGADYQALYSKNLKSNFMFIYNPDDVRLDALMTSPAGKEWAFLFSEYISALSGITGIRYPYIVCTFCTDEALWGSSKAGRCNGNYTFYRPVISSEILFGITQYAFTEELLHEVSHAFLSGRRYHLIYNSEEEMFVTLRWLCALHCMGYETRRIFLTPWGKQWQDAEAVTWKPADAAEDEPQPDSDAAQMSFPDYCAEESAFGASVRAASGKFARITPLQFLAYVSGRDSSSCQLRARLAALLNLYTEKPISHTSDEDDSNADNWIRLDAILENWASIDTEEWQRLIALCICDPMQSDQTASVDCYVAYIKSCTEPLHYKWIYGVTEKDTGEIRKITCNYRVLVTPRVAAWLRDSYDQQKIEGIRNEDCSVEYLLTGNLIQAFNTLDFVCGAAQTDEQTADSSISDLTDRDISLLNSDRYVNDLVRNHSYQAISKDFCSPVPEDNAFLQSFIALGDVDGDRKTTEADALLISLWSSGVLSFSDPEKDRADVNFDHSVDDSDRQRILDIAEGRYRFSDYCAPQITQQPSDTALPLGGLAAFTVQAAGRNLTYQWQYNKGNGWKDSTASGSRTETVELAVTPSRDGQQYRCKITSSNGRFVYSDAAAMTVGVCITKQPADVAVPAGETAVFTAEADGKDLAYQWQYNKGSDDAGWTDCVTGADAAADTLVIAADAEAFGCQYRCVISSPNGNSAVTEPVTLICSPEADPQP